MTVESSIERRLDHVRDAVAGAAAAVGRDPATVRIVAVAKYAEVDAMRAAAAAGQVDFGENYVQDALRKMEALKDCNLRWHFLGRLQSNKAAKVARTFDLIHTLASESALGAIRRAIDTESSTCRVLIQIRLAEGRERAGVAPEDAADMARAVARTPGVVLEGVMGIAPLGVPAGPHFARLRMVLARLRDLELPDAPLGEISAGMTDDFEDAIREGATIVRIGRAIFGPR